MPENSTLYEALEATHAFNLTNFNFLVVLHKSIYIFHLVPHLPLATYIYGFVLNKQIFHDAKSALEIT